jgi:hypothetical protein
MQHVPAVKEFVPESQISQKRRKKKRMSMPKRLPLRQDYRGTRFYNIDSALVMKRWLNRVEEDASGLTFQEWTPEVDTSRPPVGMPLINSTEFRATGSSSNT